MSEKVVDKIEDEDLAPTQTDGYKAPEKKTLEELQALDADDEALRKWKESLLKGAGDGSTANPNDPRKVIILSMAMEVEGRPDVSLDLSDLEKNKSSPIVIKEGIEFRMKITFRIQHEVIAGLKYLQVVKRAGIRVDKSEEMIGSYGPKIEAYEKKFPLEQAPSGMLARGTYTVRSRFIDDDQNCHLDFTWTFAIKKDWE